MTDPKREFVFEEKGPVGVFEERDHPRSPGRYRYMPFRGLGHLSMQKHLRAGGNPRCYYDIGDVRVSFTVRDCPEYGVLELEKFEVSERDTV